MLCFNKMMTLYRYAIRRLLQVLSFERVSEDHKMWYKRILKYYLSIKVKKIYLKYKGFWHLLYIDFNVGAIYRRIYVILRLFKSARTFRIPWEISQELSSITFIVAVPVAENLIGINQLIAFSVPLVFSWSSVLNWNCYPCEVLN